MGIHFNPLFDNKEFRNCLTPNNMINYYFYFGCYKSFYLNFKMKIIYKV
jgi:hypothetical protein